MACLSITCHNCSSITLHLSLHPLAKMFAYNFAAAHSAYVYYFLLLLLGNVLRAASWANFSLLLQLRVRHFRIATVIILITNTKALKLSLVLPLSTLCRSPSHTKKEINFYLTRTQHRIGCNDGGVQFSFVSGILSEPIDRGKWARERQWERERVAGDERERDVSSLF